MRNTSGLSGACACGQAARQVSRSFPHFTPGPPRRLFRSVLPGGPGAYDGQHFPGALVVRGVQPQHVEQGLLGFLEAVQLPQREGHAVQGAQVAPARKPPNGSGSASSATLTAVW